MPREGSAAFGPILVRAPDLDRFYYSAVERYQAFPLKKRLSPAYVLQLVSVYRYGEAPYPPPTPQLGVSPSSAVSHLSQPGAIVSMGH